MALTVTTDDAGVPLKVTDSDPATPVPGDTDTFNKVLIASTLGVTGAATLGSTLDVTGAVTLSAALSKSAASGITAGTTQTQVGATALTKDINRVTVCANDNDGVKLPAATAGKQVTVINASAKLLDVWPASGDAINAIAADGVYGSVGAGHLVIFSCAVAGTWNGIKTG